MRKTIEQLGQIIRCGAIVFAVSLLVMMGWMAQPSFANSLTPEEEIDRACEESEGTGIAEEVYQQRLQAGQNPEKMPKPHTRIVDLEGKEVPETSFVHLFYRDHACNISCKDKLGVPIAFVAFG